MTIGKEWKLILLFTLPIMAGSFLQQLYNTVDGIVVGQFIGEDAFAGVGTCMPLTFLFLSFAMGLSTGVGIVVSQYFGARRHDELAEAVNTSLFLLGGVGLALSVIAFAITPFLLKTFLTTPANILPYAITYFRIYSLGLVFQFIYNAISFALRGLGDSKATLYFLIVTVVLNAILTVLFVLVFRWGVAGSAIATVLAQVVCASVSYIYLRKRFTFDTKAKTFNWKMCRHILRFGIPSAIQQTIVSFGNTAMQRLINGFGEATIAAVSAGVRINMMMFVPIMGFQSGLANFTGQNIGAGNIDRVKKGLRQTLIMALGLSALLCVLTYTFAPAIVSMFNITGDALARSIQMVRFFSMVFSGFSIYMVIGGVLQGAGDVIFQTIATLSALATRIALGYLGVHFGFLGYEASWVTNPIGWGVALLIVVIRFFTGGWKNKAIVTRSTDDIEEIACEPDEEPAAAVPPEQ